MIKKNTIAFLAVSAFLFACVGPSVREFTRTDVELSQYSQLAVMEFTAPGNDSSVGCAVADLFSAELLRQGFDVIERDKVRAVLEEQAFCLTGALSEREAAKIGQILGVKAIVTGSVGQWKESVMETKRCCLIGSTLKKHSAAGLTVKLLDVSDARTLWTASGNQSGSKDVMYYGREITQKIIDRIYCKKGEESSLM